MATANTCNIHQKGFNIDALYWARLKSGDHNALGYFYDRYADGLFDIAVGLTRNRVLAQDAIQEVFVELWQYRAGIGTVDHSMAYLQKALRNKLFRQLKTALRQAELPLSDIYISADANREEVRVSAEAEKEKSYRLTRALSILSDRQRQIVTLHFYEGLSYQKIAERLRMNYQSVNNLAYRTMLRLRDHMLLFFLLCVALL